MPNGAFMVRLLEEPRCIGTGLMWLEDEVLASASSAVETSTNEDETFYDANTETGLLLGGGSMLIRDKGRIGGGKNGASSPEVVASTCEQGGSAGESTHRRKVVTSVSLNPAEDPCEGLKG
ncbi:hypothetical protein Dimus_016607 [Dionaea muscipula]